MKNDNVVFRIIDSLVSSGKIFSANFTKADGTERVMNCRVGVQKNLKGVGLKYDRRKAHNIIVWDMNAVKYDSDGNLISKGAYKTIKTDRLNWIRIEGKKYEFNVL